ncbi:predicted protein [Nematostella vectensis]|uniref:Uncharacterized protein n=2 Tax=Nematostella vectensis TaxID=45351 RepID=A7SLU1_NEMVE|nr:predicted protein [Nematostella vectensis]|eukprot:XP_001627415.1 predicted protein [Nematostella vectensis]
MPSLLSIYLIAIIVFFNSVKYVKPPIFRNNANMRITKNSFLLSRPKVARNDWEGFNTIRLTQTFRGTYPFEPEISFSTLKPMQLYPEEDNRTRIAQLNRRHSKSNLWEKVCTTGDNEFTTWSVIGSRQKAKYQMNESEINHATDTGTLKQETSQATANQDRHMLRKCSMNMVEFCDLTEFLLRYDVNAIKSNTVSRRIEVAQDNNTSHFGRYHFCSSVVEWLPPFTASERFHSMQKVWLGRVNGIVHKLGAVLDLATYMIHGFVKEHTKKTTESVGPSIARSHSDWAITRPKPRNRERAPESSQAPNDEAGKNPKVVSRDTMAQKYRARNLTTVKVINPIKPNDTKASSFTTDQASNNASVQSNKRLVPNDTRTKQTRKPFVNHHHHSRKRSKTNKRYESGFNIITILIHELYSNLEDGWNQVPDAAYLVNHLVQNFKQGLQIRHRTPERRPKVRLRDYVKKPGQTFASLFCLLITILVVWCSRRFSSWRKQKTPHFVHRRGKKRPRRNSFRIFGNDFLRWIIETTIYPVFAKIQKFCSRGNLVRVWSGVLQFTENFDG